MLGGLNEEHATSTTISTTPGESFHPQDECQQHGM
jgi:hypothetical protein